MTVALFLNTFLSYLILVFTADQANEIRLYLKLKLRSHRLSQVLYIVICLPCFSNKVYKQCAYGVSFGLRFFQILAMIACTYQLKKEFSSLNDEWQLTMIVAIGNFILILGKVVEMLMYLTLITYDFFEKAFKTCFNLLRKISLGSA